MQLELYNSKEYLLMIIAFKFNSMKKGSNIKLV